jgi:hypothetical protein
LPVPSALARVGHVRGVHLIQFREVVDVGIEDRDLHQITHRRSGGLQDGRQIAQRLIGLRLDPISCEAGGRVDARGFGAEDEAAGDDGLAVRPRERAERDRWILPA